MSAGQSLTLENIFSDKQKRESSREGGKKERNKTIVKLNERVTYLNHRERKKWGKKKFSPREL